MEGGTFKRFNKTLFCLWRRIYFGHLTKRVRSRFGGRSPPIVNFFGFAWKRAEGLFCCAPPGATFFAVLAAGAVLRGFVRN